MAAIYVGGKNFLNLDILNIYTGKEFLSTTYKEDRCLRPNIIWGDDHLTMEKYQDYQTDFRKIFTHEDLSLFTVFNNMAHNVIRGSDGGVDNNGKKMLWYLWQHCLKGVFRELGTSLDIIDLTDIGLNNPLPYGSPINL